MSERLSTLTVFRDDHELYRVQVRRFLEREIVPRYLEWEKNGIVPREVWEAAGENGLLCPSVPEEYGGGGGDFGHEAILMEEMGRINTPGIGFPTHSGVIVPYILEYGTEAQRRRWLPQLASGRSIAAIAMTEPSAGSDLKAIKTRAVADGDSYLINGQKTFISNGITADLVIVACKTSPERGAKGISLIVVERGAAGFERGRKLEKIGLHSQDTAELFFRDVRVPKENLLGEENSGFGQIMNKMPQERLLIGIRAAASIEAMLARTIEYAKERVVFGEPMLKLQNTRFKLAEAKAKATVLRAYIDVCIGRHMTGDLNLEQAAIAKLNAATLQNQILDDLLQLFGGYGFMTEYPIGRAWVDARVMRLYGGTDEIMKEIIARTL